MLDHITFRGDRLDAWLDAQGISSADVAEAVGLTYNYIYLLRLGKRPNVSALIVTKIALAVGCTPDFLCNASDDPLGRASQGGAGEVDLLLAFRALPLHRQRDVLDVAQMFAGREVENANELQDRVFEMVRQMAGDETAIRIAEVLAGRLEEKAKGKDERRKGDTSITEEDVTRAIQTGRERMGADYASLLDNEPILGDED